MSAPNMLQTLGALMSTDNALRAQAELFFNSQVESAIVPTLQELIRIFSEGSMELIIRSFAGVLLRRAIEKATKTLDPGVLNQLREALLSCWAQETNPNLLKRLAHVLAQSASGKPWLELLPRVIEAAAGKPANVLVAILNMIEIITEYCPEDIQTHLESVGGFLGAFIVSDDTNIQVACARSTAACIVSLEDEGSRNAFRSALQPIINVLGNALSRGDEVDATSIIEYLVSIAQVQPIFFKGAVDSVIAAMLTVARSDTLEFSTRSMALELMVTLTETAPALARRCAGLLEGLVPLAMSLMVDFDETEAEWLRHAYTDEPTDGDHAVGEEAIERASAGMGGRVMAPAVMALAQQYAVRPEWQYRRAAVASIARLADGCTQFFAKSLVHQSLQYLANAVKDPSPIVKFEAIQAVGRFATIFPDDNKIIVEHFLPLLVGLLTDPGTCERVRGHAASAMINTINPEHCDVDLLKPQLDSILGALLACLQGASMEVKSPVLVLLGCVAQVSEEAFAPYYAAFMPGIKQILATAVAPEQALLRGKAMECAGLLGEAVGAAVFAPDALELMTMLAAAMEKDRDNDVTFEYILPACARISSALGAQFEPFLAVVMQPILAGAALVIDFAMEDVADNEEDDDAQHNEDTGLHSAVISLGAGVRKRVTMNTHAVQQKQQASRLMYEFAKNMRGYLRGFITPCLQALLACMTDKHSSDLRSSASLALAKTFEAYMHALQLGVPEVSVETLPAVLSACLGKTLECIKGDTNPTARACAAEVMRDILQTCYESGEELPAGGRSAPLCAPDLDIATGIAEELLASCGESIKRRQEKEEAFAKNEGLEAEDREAFEEDLEEEEECLSNLVDAIGHMIKLHGLTFMPFFDAKIAPSFAPFLAATAPAQLQSSAVCMLDDAIEFGGDAAHKYIPQCLEVFLRGMSSPHTVLRQSSIYGIAQAIRVAPGVVAPFLGTLVPALAAFVSAPSAGEEDNEGSTENAVFALGLVYNTPHYRSVAWGADPAAVAGLWLKGLPLRADEQEAKLSHMQLCEAIERGDSQVLGAGYANLSHVLAILADVLADAAAATATVAAALSHPSTADRMRAIVRQLFQSGAVGGDALQAAVAPLSANQQKTLQSIIQ